jgi:hypothetical protein
MHVEMATDAFPVGIAELQRKVASPTVRGFVGTVQTESGMLVLETFADDDGLPGSGRMTEGAIFFEFAMRIRSGVRS